MLVVDNNKMKLLRMKEKLLEVLPDNYQGYLDEFKSLAIEIDYEVVASLVNHIKETNYHDLPLEEQISVLSEIIQEYDDVNELQCSFKNVYQRYTNDPLGLSDISVIAIDEIRDRISNIEGYLLNSSHIENNKNELERLNLELISEEKRRTDSIELFKNKEQQLRNSFINAEGRVNGVADTYISFVQEFNILSLDLNRLLLDNSYLEDELNKVIIDKSLMSEEIAAANICYSYVPSFENKQTCDAINKKLVVAEYKFALLELANLIAKDFWEYDSVKLKREKLQMFNEIRLECLKKMDITLSIDPFTNLKIDEQLEIIESYGDNREKISVIRRKISNVNAVLEERLQKNVDFMVALNAAGTFIKDKTTFSEVKEEIKEDESFEIDILPNQVIDVRDKTEQFMFDRAQEKADSVIRYANQLYEANEETSSEIVNPELVILSGEVPESKVDNNEEIKISIGDIDEGNTAPVLGSDSNDLFQEVIPFSDATLFDNKYEDVFENEKEKNDSMLIDLSNPDVNGLKFVGPQSDDSFWTIKPDEIEEESKIKRR